LAATIPSALFSTPLEAPDRFDMVTEKVWCVRRYYTVGAVCDSAYALEEVAFRSGGKKEIRDAN
jgi:hypothetical protein